MVRVRGISTGGLVVLRARFIRALSWEGEWSCKKGARRMTYKGWRGRENMGCLATCGVYDKR